MLELLKFSHQRIFQQAAADGTLVHPESATFRFLGQADGMPVVLGNPQLRQTEQPTRALAADGTRVGNLRNLSLFPHASRPAVVKFPHQRIFHQAAADKLTDAGGRFSADAVFLPSPHERRRAL